MSGETSASTKVPIVLLCAPSGTGLTAVADSLKAHNPQLEVRDLERFVCEMHSGTSMERVVRGPRPVLYESWRIACTSVLRDIVKAERAKRRAKKADLSPPAVVSMHLTWFNPDTSEFFSPVDLSKLQRRDCEVAHVVILIDDIYDMFRRLQGDGHLYSDDNMRQHRDMLSKLFDEPDEQGLQALAVEVALGELIAWRRAEMIQAENLAKSLGARLTVLGTKHDRRVLEILLAKPDAPRIYLSHRITEPRRHNSGNRTKRHPLGKWLAIACEVSRLHREFAAPDQDAATQGQVLINPTAIDELRFDKARRKGRRNPYLGPRWPLPKPVERLLWSDAPPGPTSEAQAEHTGILTGHDDPLRDFPNYPAAHPMTKSTANSLASRVFFEIAFRDHVIVENTPHLCAHRPFFCRETSEGESDADWSSGVKREIEHWEETQRLHLKTIPRKAIPSDLDPRLIAFIHTDREIVGRFKWLEKEPQKEFFVHDVREHLRKSWKNLGVPNSEIHKLWSSRIPTKQPGQLSLRPEEPVVVRRPREVFDAIEPAVQAALHLVFTSLLRPSDTADDNAETSPLRLHQVALFAPKESDSGSVLDLERLVSDLRTFFTGVLDEHAVKVVNDMFWRACEECFMSYWQGTELNQYIAESLLGIPYGELKTMAGR